MANDIRDEDTPVVNDMDDQELIKEKNSEDTQDDSDSGFVDVEAVLESKKEVREKPVQKLNVKPAAPIKPVKKEEKVEHKDKKEEKVSKKEEKVFKKEEKTDVKPAKKFVPLTKPVFKKTNGKVEKKPLVKKAEKKSDKKESKVKKHLFWILLTIGLIVIIAIIVILLTMNNVGNVPSTTKEIAATVNGEVITMKELDKEYEQLNPMLKQLYTKEILLNQSITKVLLLQEAKKQNIRISNAEIDSALTTIKKDNDLTEKAFEDLLAQQNITLDVLRSELEKQLLVQKIINASVLTQVHISEQDMRSYYDANTSLFSVPEQVKARHILVMSDNDSLGRTKIYDIYSRLNDTNFCDMVTQYSDDPGSKSNCGEYTFGRGEFVPEFENAAFTMNIDQTSVIKSTYGYHIIQKLAYYPTKQSTFDEVAEKINETLYNDRAQQLFDAFITQLRNSSVIVIYLGRVPIDVSNPDAGALDTFAKCITQKGAVFYGASWCPHCNNQKKEFGSSMTYIKYVECDDGNGGQTAECTQAGIESYPTWVIDGKHYSGEQTFAKLGELTGCALN